MYHTVVKPTRAAEYDGTNSAKIDEKIDDFTVVSETTTGLSFTSGGATFTVARGGYIVWAAGMVTEVFQNADDFYDAWSPVALAGHVHDLTLTSGPGKCPATYPAAPANYSMTVADSAIRTD